MSSPCLQPIGNAARGAPRDASAAPVATVGASARITREAGILAGRLSALLAGLGGSDSGGSLTDGRAFLDAAFAAAAGGAALAAFPGSALHRPGVDGPHPIDLLAAALGLDDAATDLLLLAGLPEEHEGYGAVLRALHPRGESRLAVGLAAQLLFPDAAGRLALRAVLASGPLARNGLLRVAGDGPFHECSILPAEDLWPCLHGLDITPAALPRFDADASPVALAEWLDKRRTRQAAALLKARTPCTLLIAGDNLEAMHWRGLALARAAGRHALGLALPAGADAGLQRLAQAHALVRGAVPVVRIELPETQAPEPGEGAALMPDFPEALILCARPGAVPARPAQPLIPIPMEPLSPAARRTMWQCALPSLSDQAARLAARFPVEPLMATRVAGDMEALAETGGAEPSLDDLAASLRARAGLQLSSAVKLLRPVAGWPDLVLPPDRCEQLKEAVSRLALQATVIDEWGFLAGRAGVHGVRMLFSGPPGTGKTLAAEVMAGALQTDLLVVDLSRVMSKWIGETEKNLAAVFDSAERAQAVLFFDEADALFGRRTEVSDAHDRYANLETAYLLQRLERFEGLAVLATNLRQNIDPAFARRLEFALDFEEPNQGGRDAIWRAHVPAAAPVGPEVSFSELAALYPVVGGLIRNAAVAGAFLAAAEGVPIGRRHLVRAMRREYAKAGRAFPGPPPGLEP